MAQEPTPEAPGVTRAAVPTQPAPAQDPVTRQIVETVLARAPDPIVPQPQLTGAVVIILTGVTFVAGWFLAPGWNLVGIAAAMTALVLILGKAISGRALGVLINERNLMSLSRFQMMIWTIVVMASYFAYAIARIKASNTDPLNVAIDWHLWALLGISTTSLIGGPLILGTKKDQVPDPVVVEQTARENAEPAAEVEQNREGTLYANATIGDARFTDLFQGDEVGNTSRLDLSKVQMFYFTIIAALAFAVTVIKNLGSNAPDLSQLPKLADGLVAILGISHAGYLSSKAVDHTAKKTSAR